MFFRSLLFYFFFVIGTVLFFGIFSPVKFFSREITVKLSSFWTRSVILLSKFVMGVNYEIIGKENIPKDKSFILVSNHQSAWETFFYVSFFNDPVFLLKKELKAIPIFSSFCERLGFIYVDRKEKYNSLKHVLRSIKNLVKDGVKIFVIFPQGTRVKPNEQGEINSGFFALHKNLDLPILPVRHNSGDYWINKSFFKRKGSIKVEIFPLVKKIDNKESAIREIKNYFFT